MDRKEAKELLPIIQAFANGMNIQYRRKGSNEWNDVDTCTNVAFNYYDEEYRIKPELKYRPFNTAEECWNEMHKHPDFGWLKNKATGSLAIIGNISERKDKKPIITWATNEGFNFLASDVFNDYTFTDGTPFGVKE